MVSLSSRSPDGTFRANRNWSWLAWQVAEETSLHSPIPKESTLFDLLK